MMATVNILRDKIADDRADEHVRRKMLLRSQPRNIHQTRQSVDEYLRESAGILVRNDSRHGPVQHAVCGRHSGGGHYGQIENIACLGWRAK